MVGCGQTPEPAESEGVVRLPDRSGGWQASGDAVSYDAESIFGYIDGHAEVYLAYGMRRCLSRRYVSSAGAEVVVDLFEMASPADAYGVFTHDLSGETMAVGHGARLRPGWLSLWYGRWFVSLYSDGVVEPQREATVGLARAMVESIPDQGNGAVPELVEALPEDGLVPSSERFLRSFGILNTHLYLGPEDPFGLGPDSSAVLAEYDRGGETAYLLLIELPELGRAQAAVDEFAGTWLSGTTGAPVERKDGWFAIERSDRRVVVVLAAESLQLGTVMLADGLQNVGHGGTS